MKKLVIIKCFLALSSVINAQNVDSTSQNPDPALSLEAVTVSVRTVTFTESPEFTTDPDFTLNYCMGVNCNPLVGTSLIIPSRRVNSVSDIGAQLLATGTIPAQSSGLIVRWSVTTSEDFMNTGAPVNTEVMEYGASAAILNVINKANAGTLNNFDLLNAGLDVGFDQGNLNAIQNAVVALDTIPTSTQELQGVADQALAVLSVASIEELEDISLYPNPTKGKVTIKGAEVKDVKVYNLSGQQVSVGKNFSHLSKGTYLVEIVTNKGIALKRIIKE